MERLLAKMSAPETLQRVAVVLVVCYAVLVLTGGAVRLTGSGLGCADWPECFRGRLIAESSFHSEIEFSNRLITILVGAMTGVAFLVSLARRPWRRDLVALTVALVLGLGAQAVIGGIVVLTKLNPYLVALHFLLTLVVLGGALLLHHRSRAAPSPAKMLVGRDVVWLSRLLVGGLCVVIGAGTIVTGSGPHAGGPGAARIPVAFRDMAELHSTLALFLIGLTLATLFALHAARAPQRVQFAARTLMEVLFVQGALGYTQYFLHDATVVIEFHLAGATAAWTTAIWYYLSLHGHPLGEGEALTLSTSSRRQPISAEA